MRYTMLWISSLCLIHEPLEIALEHLGALTRGVEIVDGGRHRIASPDLLESFSYRYSMQIPHKDINPASVIEPIRQASLVAIKERFVLAAEIGADVIISAGYVSQLEDMPYARNQLSRSLSELILSAKEYGISFSVTNAGRWRNACVRNPDDITRLGPVPLALDIGNAHVNGCLLEFLNESASKYIYLYDSNGISQNLLEVGRGTIPFAKIARAYHANGARGVIREPSHQSAYNSIKALYRYGIR